MILLVSLASLGLPAGLVPASMNRISPNRYRLPLTVDPRGQTRSNSPVGVEIDFPAALAAVGARGTFDRHTIEVVAYDAQGEPKVFDASRAGYEQYLLPWRIENYYRLNKVRLSFVLPDHTCTRCAVYFDTVESGLGKPQRYPGLVGDGDWFTVGYGRREVNASGYDTWCDFDGDGDLDLFKGGTEPYVYVYENVGGGRMIDRGYLTDGGDRKTFPMDGNIRSWNSLEFCDWDRDGDQDLFVHSPTGDYAGEVIVFENITPPGGPLAWADPHPVRTVTNRAFGAIVSFVDFDGDGKTDAMGGREGMVVFYRNVGTNDSIHNIQLADGVYIKANGVEIELGSARVDCPDIDADGDLDLFVGTEEGRVYFFENVGTRTNSIFTIGRVVAFYEYMDARAGVKVTDFDGDGLLDVVPGRYWERTQWGEQPRVFGRMYKNVGTATTPRFEPRDASAGAPCTERFQNADAVRQNGVRAVNWNNDGRTDLIAGDTDGFVWFFRNTTNHLFPVFAPGEKILAAGVPLRVYGEEDYNRAAGYARVDICDWNNDGRKDLLVADGRGWLTLYLNQGTDAHPVLAAGTRVIANGKPIDGTPRGSVLVCDWNNDGRKDVIFGMVGQSSAGTSQYYDWPPQPPNTVPTYSDSGFLFYKNTGSDGDPVLASPTWIKAAGNIIKYPSRPNLGDFVDWDGDGKKDFIAAEFEHAVHFYKNTSSGDPNVEPELAAGITILRASVFQTISGADVIDWNRDGDLDILTGQGHGGSGLRFYERDDCNDYVNQTVYGQDTWPRVTVGAVEITSIRTDFDDDLDVDLEDFGRFQACLSGSGALYAAGCGEADLDADVDVDQYDFDILQACMSGANVPADPDCAN